MKVFKPLRKSVNIVNLSLDFAAETSLSNVTTNNFYKISVYLLNLFPNLKMRAISALIFLMVVALAVAMPFPQNFDEAVRQAQQMSLIPTGAVVDRTSSGIQVAYFKLGDNDRVNPEDLRSALEGIPPEIVASLESQVANVGRNL